MFSKLLKFFKLGRRVVGIEVGNWKTCDSSIPFRMGAGFPGDVNRTHPASIEPCLADPTNPPALYGVACMVNPATNAVRGVVPGDSTATSIYGITVRPWPVQQQSGSLNANYGNTALVPNQPVDVLKSGYIIVQLSNPTVKPTKGGTVYVWVAASSGAHTQGLFEAAATSGSTITLDSKSYFNGVPDANNYVEVAFNL